MCANCIPTEHLFVTGLFCGYEWLERAGHGLPVLSKCLVPIRHWDVRAGEDSKHHRVSPTVESFQILPTLCIFLISPDPAAASFQEPLALYNLVCCYVLQGSSSLVSANNCKSFEERSYACFLLVIFFQDLDWCWDVKLMDLGMEEGDF